MIGCGVEMDLQDIVEPEVYLDQLACLVPMEADLWVENVAVED
jgi:hypothetical protein